MNSNVFVKNSGKPVGNAAITLIKDELMGAGELLRSNALRPDEDSLANKNTFELFD